MEFGNRDQKILNPEFSKFQKFGKYELKNEIQNFGNKDLKILNPKFSKFQKFGKWKLKNEIHNFERN